MRKFFFDLLKNLENFLGLCFQENNGFLKVSLTVSFSFLGIYMERKESTMSSSGVTVVGSDAPSDYHVAPRTTENPSQLSGSEPLPPVIVTPPQVGFTPSTAVAAGVDGTTTVKKKRGRPRKYAPDGSVTKVISPKPISSSAPPPVIDFSAAQKRGKIHPVGSTKKSQNPRMELEGKD